MSAQGLPLVAGRLLVSEARRAPTLVFVGPGPVAHLASCLLSWFMGRRPEYTDPKVVAQGEGREGKA